MFAVEKAPRYVEEAERAAARLQEQTTPRQYGALVRRAERLLDGLFKVDVKLDRGTMVKIALRERFIPARVKQAILMAATHQLIADLAAAWSVNRRVAAPAGQPAPAAAPARELVLA